MSTVTYQRCSSLSNGDAGDGTATFVFVNLDLSCPAQECSVSCVFSSRYVRSLRTGAQSVCGHRQGQGRKRGIRTGDGADLYPKQLAKPRSRATEKIHSKEHGIESDGTMEGDKQPILVRVLLQYSTTGLCGLVMFGSRPCYGRSTGRRQMSAPATTRGDVQASGDQFRRILRQRSRLWCRDVIRTVC